MQPGRGVELLRVPGDSLPRALWWGCEEAPPRSGEDMCLGMAHVPALGPGRLTWGPEQPLCGGVGTPNVPRCVWGAD